MAEVSFEQTAELILRGDPGAGNVTGSHDDQVYIVTAAVRSPLPSSPTLYIEAEQKSNGSRWTGEFSAQYIEELTHKTGNSKKFGVFVKMLAQALSQPSSDHGDTTTASSVFIDLLTWAELEAVKARRTGRPAAVTAATSKNINKRYIILTYAVEFDRVHYPLPLIGDDRPDTVKLQATIARIRTELHHAQAQQSSSGATEKLRTELYRLAEENRKLKSSLRNGSGNTAASSTSTGGASSPDANETIDTLHEEVQQLRRLLQQQTDVNTIGNSSSAIAMRVTELEHNLSISGEELRSERAAAKQMSTKHRRQQRVLVEELERAVESERQWRMQCHRLTKELELLRASATSSRLSSSSSPSLRRPLSAGSRASSSATTGGTGSRPSSRPRSRSNSRPSSRTSSPAQSPKSSTTGFGRFDPSAYVRAQEEKKLASAHRRRGSGSSTPPLARSQTPPPSGHANNNNNNNSNNGSGRTSRNRSPASSRPSSAERVRQAARVTVTNGSPSLSRTNSNSNNRIPGGGHTASTAARIRPLSATSSGGESPRSLRPLSATERKHRLGGNSATSSPSSKTSADRKASIAARYGVTTSSSSSGLAGDTIARNRAPPNDTAASSSVAPQARRPTRAAAAGGDDDATWSADDQQFFRSVKAWSTDGSPRRSGDGGAGSTAAASSSSSLENGRAEIANIDERLSSLQRFLKASRST